MKRDAFTDGLDLAFKTAGLHDEWHSFINRLELHLGPVSLFPDFGLIGFHAGGMTGGITYDAETRRFASHT